MKLSKRFIIFPILTIFIVMFGLVSIYNKPTILRFIYTLGYHKSQNLEFSIKPCSQDVSGYDMDKMGIKEVNWNNSSTVSIKAYVSTFCGGENISFPSFSITNNDLILKYASIKGNRLTNCLCAKELNYVINNIPKENYNVILKGNNL